MERGQKVPWYGYLAFVLTVIFLSGIFTNSQGPLAALDFSNVLGEFGALGVVHEEGTVTLANDFLGMGGTGLREGFLLVLSITPAICLAFGVIELFNHYKGLDAAQVLLSPIMKPIFGLPGASAVAFVANLISADAGAAITRSLYESKAITTKQNVVMTSFQVSSPQTLINFFVVATPLLPFLPVSMSVLLLIVIVMKFVGAIIARFLFARIDD